MIKLEHFYVVLGVMLAIAAVMSLRDRHRGGTARHSAGDNHHQHRMGA